MGWNGEPWPGRPTVLSTYLGPVRLIHHKALKHPHGLCKLVNAQQQYSSNAAASATRVVVGATACAMHDLSEIRVHEIGDGSPWLAAD